MTSPFDLFGFQAFWNVYIYPILTNPLIYFLMTLVLAVAVYYEYIEFRLMKNRLEKVMDLMSRYVKGTDQLLTHAYGPDVRKELENMSAAIAGWKEAKPVQELPT